ncbi:uncharacterized protein AKAME5_002620900 [Lates japonicus]|uniref:Ig-like domain-containing protein n=1 Tax=Lates japonicus TaxID=270547 RepID=A0AAD3NHP0_LATJO|nr:uncharacterized protein AKAME5_002620900 [Lates japonicus]
MVFTLSEGECFQPIRSQQTQPLANLSRSFIYLSVSYSTGCHGSRSGSGPVIIDQESCIRPTWRKTSLLCLASGMFPPLVQFSWERQDGSSDKGEQLELRESGRTTSILLVDRDAFYTYKYQCYVKHETGTVEAQTQQEVTAPPPPPPGPVLVTWYRETLLCLLYTVLIMKSLVYCCGLSLLMMLRNKAPSTNHTYDN